MQSKIKKVWVVSKPKIEDLSKILKRLRDWFSERGVETILDADSARAIDDKKSGFNRENIPENVDLVIVLGGDGTILSVGHSAARQGVPLLGVNMGGLGFLAETTLSEMYRAFELILQGKYEISERRVLTSSLIRTGKEIDRCDAVNDVVVDNTVLARMIQAEIYVDNNFVTRLRSDGLIIATPTGSTAYSLSAGGPILAPEMDAIILTPICPHTLTYRPLVVSGSSTIKIINNATKGGAHLTVDGQRGIELKPQDTIEITRSEHKLKLVKSFTKSWFEILSEKLRWGHDTKRAD